MKSFTITDISKLGGLLKHGYELDKPRSDYEQKRFLGPATVVVYKSGKLVIQGTKAAEDSCISLLQKLEVFPKSRTGIYIGSDESLKGDTFGGIVVAAVFADDNTRKFLEDLGVHDSKRYSHKQIHELAAEIKAHTKHVILNIYPEEYNKSSSVTTLLNNLHKRAAAQLGRGTHVVDKFPGCAVGDVREEKAEDKFVEVAAASVLARDAAIHQMEELSKLAGFPLPLGSTHVAAELAQLKLSGLDPEKFVKLSFHNVKTALDL